MNRIIIEKIFQEHDLGKIISIKKIEIGFTNEVFLINDKLMLKVCEDKSNEEQFEQEVFFYNFFKKQIHVPEIKIFDKSRSIYSRFFTIYPKIEGDNLYSKWHLFSNEERKTIIKQLCDILKIINNASVEKFITAHKIKFIKNWHDKIIDQIQSSLIKIEQKKLLSDELLKVIKKFVTENHHVLKEQEMALVYWDAHFDNILVKGPKIVGLLDFERTELASIDFILDILKRMTEYPKKYMSAASEKYARKEDYVHLLDWFREFYPELFDFKDLDTRLDLYSIKHDLDTLIAYPDSVELKQMIAKTVSFI